MNKLIYSVLLLSGVCFSTETFAQLRNVDTHSAETIAHDAGEAFNLFATIDKDLGEIEADGDYPELYPEYVDGNTTLQSNLAACAQGKGGCIKNADVQKLATEAQALQTEAMKNFAKLPDAGKLKDDIGDLKTKTAATKADLQNLAGFLMGYVTNINAAWAKYALAINHSQSTPH